jgi:hypothetical protein
MQGQQNFKKYIKLFLYRILTAIFVFLMFISTLRSDCKPLDAYTVVDSSKYSKNL